MSAEKNIEKSKAQLEAIGVEVNLPLLEKIVKRLGIANQSVDASNVAASDPKEVARVKQNFAVKKLEQVDNEDLDKVMSEVMAQMKPHKLKQRGAIYYLLTVKFGKESLYI